MYSDYRPPGQNDFVEVYGPAKEDTILLPDSVVGPIFAFIVDDVTSARAEILATGIELLRKSSGQPTDWAGSSCGYRMETHIALNKSLSERKHCLTKRQWTGEYAAHFLGFVY